MRCPNCETNDVHKGWFDTCYKCNNCGHRFTQSTAEEEIAEKREKERKRKGYKCPLCAGGFTIQKVELLRKGLLWGMSRVDPCSLSSSWFSDPPTLHLKFTCKCDSCGLKYIKTETRKEIILSYVSENRDKINRGER